MEDRKGPLRAELVAARAELLTAIQQLGDADWDRPTTNPAWSARDILIHLTLAEPGLLARAQRILAGTSELPPDFDLNVWNNRQVAKRQGAPIGELVEGLQSSRREVLAFLDGLSDAKLDVRGWHPSRRVVSVAEMFAILAQHERGHARDILSAAVVVGD